MSKIFTCIIGKSGSGKTSIVEKLQEQYNLTSIPSYTTREQRFDGEEGHIFISEDTYEFLKDEIVAYANIYGNHYFATNYQVNEHDTYVVDYIGYLDLFKNYKGDKKIVSIYIDVDMDTRSERMVKQNRTMSDIIDRLKQDDDVFDKVREKCDYVVMNYNLDSAVNLIIDIIKHEEVKICN